MKTIYIVSENQSILVPQQYVFVCIADMNIMDLNYILIWIKILWIRLYLKSQYPSKLYYERIYSYMWKIHFLSLEYIFSMLMFIKNNRRKMYLRWAFIPIFCFHTKESSVKRTRFQTPGEIDLHLRSHMLFVYVCIWNI